MIHEAATLRWNKMNGKKTPTDEIMFSIFGCIVWVRWWNLYLCQKYEIKPTKHIHSPFYFVNQTNQREREWICYRNRKKIINKNWLNADWTNSRENVCWQFSMLTMNHLFSFEFDHLGWYATHSRTHTHASCVSHHKPTNWFLLTFFPN